MRPNIEFKKILKKGVGFLLALGVIVSQISYIPQLPWLPRLPRISANAEGLVEWVWADPTYDLLVDAYDASLVLQRYALLSTGQDVSSPQYDGRWDPNFDGFIDASDASLILQQYAKVSTGGYVKYMDSKGVYIRLPKGRTFSGIAVEEGIPQAELEKINPEITDINNLPMGQIIYVMMRPVTGTTTTTKATTTKETSTATKAIAPAKKTTKPTTIATTATSTTKKITTTITSTIVTDKPVTNTKPVTGFVKGHTYKLAPGYPSWVIYSDEKGLNTLDTLYQNQLIQIEETELKGNMFKGKLENGAEVYIRVSPENYGMWVEVSSTVIEKTTTTTVNKPITTTTIIKQYTNSEEQWKIRSSREVLADDSNVLCKISTQDPYYTVFQVVDGWEYVCYNEVYGWMKTNDFPDNFVIFTGEVTTTAIKTTTKVITQPSITVPTKPVIVRQYELPDNIKARIQEIEAQYEGCRLSVCISDVDGKFRYGYRADERVWSFCTVKASYALFVALEADKHNIEMESYKLPYLWYMLNTGSGVIKEKYSFGSMIPLSELYYTLIHDSDNTSYNIIMEDPMFSMDKFKAWLSQIGGQTTLWYPDGKYATTSANERINEWVQIYDYITGNYRYSSVLANNLANARFLYLGWGTKYHKSGSGSYDGYMGAGDGGVVGAPAGNDYLMVILNMNDTSEDISAEHVNEIANLLKEFVNWNGIF